MKPILVLNPGSTSFKFKLFQLETARMYALKACVNALVMQKGLITFPPMETSCRDSAALKIAWTPFPAAWIF